MNAHEILTEAARILEERGKLRDTEEGERSMARAVAAYNSLTGESLSEDRGWLFMCCLKMARATAGAPHLDDMQDLAGYAALWGECVSEATPDPSEQRAEEDGWIEWKGGECPVESDTRVDVRLRDGDVYRGDPAFRFRWGWSSTYPEGDIVAYKVVG